MVSRLALTQESIGSTPIASAKIAVFSGRKRASHKRPSVVRLHVRRPDIEVSTSGKSPVSETGHRWFESIRLSQNIRY